MGNYPPNNYPPVNGLDLTFFNLGPWLGVRKYLKLGLYIKQQAKLTVLPDRYLVGFGLNPKP